MTKEAGKTTRAGQQRTDWGAIRDNRDAVDWRKKPACWKGTNPPRNGVCPFCELRHDCEHETINRG